MEQFSCMENLTFVAMSPETIDACTEIAMHAPDPWSQKDLETATEDLNQWSFVALLDAEPVAFACFLTVAGSADLRLIAVSDAHQRKGIGQQLLYQCLRELRNQGVEQCLLEVRESNQKAIQMYKKLGFKSLAHRKNLYSNPPEHGFLMAVSTTRFI